MSSGGTGTWVDKTTVTKAAGDDDSPASTRASGDAPHPDEAAQAAGRASLIACAWKFGAVLTIVIVAIHFSTGCGNSPCAHSSQGECSGFLWAECTCTSGVYSGEHCQYSDVYDVSGCSNPATCGSFNRTLSKCDDAPVYQLGGWDDAPVLYRSTTANQREASTNWAVGPAARREDCAPIPVLGGAEGVPNATEAGVGGGSGIAFVYARSYYNDVEDKDSWEPQGLSPSASGCVFPLFPQVESSTLASQRRAQLQPPPPPRRRSCPRSNRCARAPFFRFAGKFGGWRDFEAPMGEQLGAIVVRDAPSLTRIAPE